MNPLMNSGVFGSAFSGSNLANEIFGSSLPFGSAIPASYQMQFLNGQSSNPALLQSGIYGSSLGASLRAANQLQVVGSATNGLYGGRARAAAPALSPNEAIYKILYGESEDEEESESEDDLLQYLLQQQGIVAPAAVPTNPYSLQSLLMAQESEDEESASEDDALLQYLLQSQAPGAYAGLF